MLLNYTGSLLVSSCHIDLSSFSLRLFIQVTDFLFANAPGAILFSCSPHSSPSYLDEASIFAVLFAGASPWLLIRASQRIQNSLHFASAFAYPSGEIDFYRRSAFPFLYSLILTAAADHTLNFTSLSLCSVTIVTAFAVFHFSKCFHTIYSFIYIFLFLFLLAPRIFVPLELQTAFLSGVAIMFQLLNSINFFSYAGNFVDVVFIIRFSFGAGFT